MGAADEYIFLRCTVGGKAPLRSICQAGVYTQCNKLGTSFCNYMCMYLHTGRAESYHPPGFGHTSSLIFFIIVYADLAGDSCALA